MVRDWILECNCCTAQLGVDLQQQICMKRPIAAFLHDVKRLNCLALHSLNIITILLDYFISGRSFAFDNKHQQLRRCAFLSLDSVVQFFTGLVNGVLGGIGVPKVHDRFTVHSHSVIVGCNTKGLNKTTHRLPHTHFIIEDKNTPASQILGLKISLGSLDRNTVLRR
jgi:hypothetical protein